VFSYGPLSVLNIVLVRVCLSLNVFVHMAYQPASIFILYDHLGLIFEAVLDRSWYHIVKRFACDSLVTFRHPLQPQVQPHVRHRPRACFAPPFCLPLPFRVLITTPPLHFSSSHQHFNSHSHENLTLPVQITYSNLYKTTTKHTLRNHGYHCTCREHLHQDVRG
jgi:hypothetical protein